MINLTELDALEAKATKGPIVFGDSELHNGKMYNGYVVGPKPEEFKISSIGEFYLYNDADFYQAIRNAYPAISKELRESRDLLDDTFKLFKCMLDEDDEGVDKCDFDWLFMRYKELKKLREGGGV